MEKPDTAEWTWLKPHALRDALIIVAPPLTLEQVAQAMSANQGSQIQEWISTKRLSKPAEADLKAWDQDPGRKFWCLVVQPFVLIQRLDS